MVVLAASNEEELIQWMQALCEAQIEVRERERERERESESLIVLFLQMPGSPRSPTIRKPCFFCALLITQNMVSL